MGEEKHELRALPDQVLGQIIHNLQTFPNETVDFRQPHLRQSLLQVYQLFLVLYGLLMVAGSASNVAMVTHILRRRLFREDPTCAFLMNIGACNIFMSLLLLPLSLAVLLIQNWIFGSFLCYFLPMLQDVPLHATMGTLVVVAVDRYRLLVTPHRRRLPPLLTVLAVWILSVAIVLPYAVYMNYTDLQVILGAQFEGVGICAVNLNDDKTGYIRCLFIALFVLPLALIILLHARVSVVLDSLEAPLGLDRLEPRLHAPQQEVWSPQDYRVFSTFTRAADCHYHRGHQLPSLLTPTTVGGGSQTPTLTVSREAPTPSLQQLDGSELDVVREKRNQRYIVTIVTAFAICLCPLMVLRLVKNMVGETTQNSAHFDVTFVSIVWVAFLPTLTTPALFAMWKMSRSTTTRDRLQGHLCLGQRERRSSLSHELPPMVHTCHAGAAHLLSRGPSHVPATPPHAHQACHTPTFAHQHQQRPHSLALPS